MKFQMTDMDLFNQGREVATMVANLERVGKVSRRDWLFTLMEYKGSIQADIYDGLLSAHYREEAKEILRGLGVLKRGGGISEEAFTLEFNEYKTEEKKALLDWMMKSLLV